ncbi:MAG: serine/threonine protein kinase [Planctomycetia bacterium]|nr:serine/threonine protein kinase [Planctomycetia bacterium]
MTLTDFFARLFGGSPRVRLEQRYERLQESVSGTMSQFYKARDHQTGAVVGLKIIDPQKLEPIEARYKGLGKPSEGEIGQRVTGPNIVKTLAWGVAGDGRPYVVQEFVEGTLLHALLSARKALPPQKRLDLVRQAAAAVATVHRAGFVHRDVCPRNFILRPDGRLVLIDFGLAVPDKPVFLQPGNRIGTPNYMAPEVVRRRQADKRLDVFSCGVTAYEICTLDLPWPRGTSGKAALSHDSPPADIRERWPDIPGPLAEAIMACIAADPARRPETLDAFLARIKGVALDAAPRPS